jgi:hypothetical protein
MAFKDYNEVREPLVLPINGKQYTIPPLGFQDGADLLAREKEKTGGDLDDDVFFATILGPVLAEMRADNVPGEAVTRAALTAFADHQRGRAVAEVMWETGGDPKALDRMVAQAKAEVSPTVASSTPRRASGSSRRKTPPKK